jgi:hypothetical protein
LAPPVPPVPPVRPGETTADHFALIHLALHTTETRPVHQRTHRRPELVVVLPVDADGQICRRRRGAPARITWGSVHNELNGRGRSRRRRPQTAAGRHLIHRRPVAATNGGKSGPAWSPGGQVGCRATVDSCGRSRSCADGAPRRLAQCTDRSAAL